VAEEPKDEQVPELLARSGAKLLQNSEKKDRTTARKPIIVDAVAFCFFFSNANEC